jgi:multiple sugar transport system substrate-binding protein
METKETASGPVVARGATSPTRRWLLGRVPVLLGAPGALAAACGQAAHQEATGARPGGPAPAEVIWTSWATDDLGMSRVKEQADLYAQEFPQTKVTIANVASAQYQDKLLTSLAGGSGPDVFRDNPADAIPLIQQGHLQELDGLLKGTRDSWYGSKDVKSGVMEWGRARGKQFGFPMGTGAYYAFSVNRNLFRNAGLPDPPLKYDDPSWTFDRVLDHARKLTRRTGAGPEQLGIDLGMSWSYLHPLVMSQGGGFMQPKTGEFRWHEAAATEAIQWMADLRLKHQVAPTAAEQSGGLLAFEKGRTALRWSTFNLAMYLLTTVGDQFEWDILPPAHAAGKKPVIWFYVSWWVLNRATKVTDAAWHFMHWVSGPKGQRVEVEYTWTAPHFFSLDSKFGLRMGTAGSKKNLAVAQDFMPYASPERPELNPRYSESMKVLNPALTQVAEGELTAKQAMEQIKPQMDALLKQGVAEDR